MSTLNGGPGNTVTDGLVLYLDAANYLSYTSGSTTWRDLANNSFTGSLVNGPTFNSSNAGSIVFDGVDDECNLGNILFTASIANSCSFDIWFNPLDIRGNRYYFSKGSGAAGVGGMTFALTSTSAGQRCRFQMDSSAPLRLPYIEFLTPTGSWLNLTLTYDGATVRGYRNSITSNNFTSSLAGPLASVTSPIKLANDTFGATGNCYISNFKIYNRALTAAEVLQNYNAQKSRFGL
jgi:hypothetical protein